MKTAKDEREEAERCVRLSRQTIDGAVASALLAYAGALEQRANLIDDINLNTSRAGRRPVVPATPMV